MYINRGRQEQQPIDSFTVMDDVRPSLVFFPSPLRRTACPIVAMKEAKIQLDGDRRGAKKKYETMRGETQATPPVLSPYTKKHTDVLRKLLEGNNQPHWVFKKKSYLILWRKMRKTKKKQIQI